MSNPTFQHRHYKTIARALMAATPLARDNEERHRQWQHDRNALATMFERDNERFDRARFYAATEGNPSNGKDRVP